MAQHALIVLDLLRGRGCRLAEERRAVRRRGIDRVYQPRGVLHGHRPLAPGRPDPAGRDREMWLPRLLAPIGDGGISRLEWLGAAPSGKGPTSLEAQIEKVSFLKQLGADRLVLRDLPLAGLEWVETQAASPTK
jgi:hypothetical protein